MRPRLSEEQRRARRCQTAIVCTLAAVLGTAYGLGPGLRTIFLQRALAHRDQAWAAEWIYRIARLEELTFRRDAAQELYVELWLHDCGDEGENEGLLEVVETYHPSWEVAYLPWEAARYDEDRRRPPWTGGEGAAPHPRLPDALIRHARFYEDQRRYVESTFLFRVVARCFSGTPAGAQAEQGLLRAKLNPYAPG
jgi:hypothetical protein